MNKVISILFITFFYSSYSFSICKFNPYPIGNVYVPDQTIFVQYDSSETILKVIDIPITSNTFSYSTSDSNSCNFTFSTGWFHWVESSGTYQVMPSHYSLFFPVHKWEVGLTLFIIITPGPQIILALLVWLGS